MKTKQHFAVNSKNYNLLKAFKEACETMGWPFQYDYFPAPKKDSLDYNGDPLYFTNMFRKSSGEPFGKSGFCISQITDDVPKYTLPQDWDLALNRAKELFESDSVVTIKLNDIYSADICHSLEKVQINQYKEIPTTSGLRTELIEITSVSFGLIKKLYDAFSSKGNSFKKSDLRSGMLTLNQKGEYGLVLLNTCLLESATGSVDVIAGAGSDIHDWCGLDNFNDDLTASPSIGPDRSIVKIWAPGENRYKASFKVKDKGPLLYERSESVTVDLGLGWPTKISDDRKTVAIGCQTFSFEKIEELSKLINKE
jgi:hypothetical protein